MRGMSMSSPVHVQPSVQDMMQFSSSMSFGQILQLTQFLQEQIRTRQQSPEMFGQIPAVRSDPFVPDLQAAGLPLPSMSVHQSATPGRNVNNGNANQQVDVFSKSEKWIGTPPTPKFETWKDRESEVLGWSQYLSDLGSWASQASLEFGHEIAQAARWSTVIAWSSMTVLQRARSMRLLAILKSTFSQHPRTCTLVNAFVEGVSLVSLSFGATDPSQEGNGFELLRQLTNTVCEQGTKH